MLFIYLVLGCWLGYSMPDIATWTLTAWYIAAAVTIFGFWFMAVVTTANVVDEQKAQAFVPATYKRVAVISLSALLSGHPVVAVLLAVSLYSVWGALKIKKLLAK